MAIQAMSMNDFSVFYNIHAYKNNYYSFNNFYWFFKNELFLYTHRISILRIVTCAVQEGSKNVNDSSRYILNII